MLKYKKFIICCTLLTSTLGAIDNWADHYFQGSKYSNNYEFAKAIDEYTKAIEFSHEKHFSIYIERGVAYLRTGYEDNQNYEKALNDFNLVINNQNASKEEKSDSLWGRSQTYLIQGKFKEFASDVKELQKIEPFYSISYEESGDYVIFKMSNRLRFNKVMETSFIKMLLVKNYINSENDVVFTSSGIGIIKKNGSVHTKNFFFDD